MKRVSLGRASAPSDTSSTMRSAYTNMREDRRRNLGRCCRIDLAAIDARGAASFYLRMFGWKARSIKANGGEFVELSAYGKTVASLYRLTAAQINRGVPSHWTPYIGVTDIDEATIKAIQLGGAVIVEPFRVDGLTRVSLIADSGGALLGLWELPA